MGKTSVPHGIYQALFGARMLDGFLSITANHMHRESHFILILVNWLDIDSASRFDGFLSENILVQDILDLDRVEVEIQEQELMSI